MDKELQTFKSIINYLDEKRIPFRYKCEEVGELHAYNDPKDLRIFYQDIEYEWESSNLKIHHTGNFYYNVFWNYEGRTAIKQQRCKNQREVINLLKKIDKEFNTNYKQFTLL